MPKLTLRLHAAPEIRMILLQIAFTAATSIFIVLPELTLGLGFFGFALYLTHRQKRKTLAQKDESPMAVTVKPSFESMTFEPNQSLSILVLTAGTNQPEVQMQGIVEEVSGTCLRVSTQYPLINGQAVRVLLEDGLVLAHVVFCDPERSGTENFRIGLELKEVLHHIGQLSMLINGIRGTSPARNRALAS